jgi:hypothetical protein
MTRTRGSLVLILLAATACGDDSGGGGTPDGGGGGPPTAFRFSDLDLRDPHIWVAITECTDVTEPGGIFSVNNELEIAVTTDDDGDGKLDLSPVLVMRPLTQGSGSTDMSVFFADCTAPIDGTSCMPGATAAIDGTATNMASGTCLGPEAGTTSAYTPAVGSTSGSCFVSDTQQITVDLSGIPIPLTDARVAATYGGDPADSLTNGLLMGFIDEATADTTMLPSSLPLVGGDPLSSVLAGGNGACPTTDDRDMHNGASGWWFYLNFPAAKVTWTE